MHKIDRRGGGGWGSKNRSLGQTLSCLSVETPFKKKKLHGKLENQALHIEKNCRRTFTICDKLPTQQIILEHAVYNSSQLE